MDQALLTPGRGGRARRAPAGTGQPAPGAVAVPGQAALPGLAAVPAPAAGAARLSVPTGGLVPASVAVPDSVERPAASVPRHRRAPLFLVGGLEGPPHPGVPLASALADAGTLCRGLDLPGRDGARPLDDVRAMAAYLLPRVLLGQPKGPYQLAGYGFGGIVAYELGRLLRGLGQPVARVFLLDAALPVPGQDAPPPSPTLAVRELARMRHLACLWQDTCRCGVDHNVPLSLQGGRIARALGAIDPAGYEDHIMAAIDTYTAALRAYARYQPGPSDLAVVLVRAADAANSWGLPSQVALASSPCLGWERVPVGELRARAVPGDHATLFSGASLWEVATVIQSLLLPHPTPFPAPPAAPLE
jgi:thioesterase domain-containing protein